MSEIDILYQCQVISNVQLDLIGMTCYFNCSFPELSFLVSFECIYYRILLFTETPYKHKYDVKQNTEIKQYLSHCAC